MSDIHPFPFIESRLDNASSYKSEEPISKDLIRHSSSIDEEVEKDVQIPCISRSFPLISGKSIVPIVGWQFDESVSVSCFRIVIFFFWLFLVLTEMLFERNSSV
jgi:hypothetical protein